MDHCEICGRSEEECGIARYKGCTLCRKHISQLCRHGHFLDQTIYDRNEYIIEGDVARIILKDRHC